MLDSGPITKSSPQPETIPARSETKIEKEEPSETKCKTKSEVKNEDEDEDDDDDEDEEEEKGGSVEDADIRDVKYRLEIFGYKFNRCSMYILRPILVIGNK